MAIADLATQPAEIRSNRSHCTGNQQSSQMRHAMHCFKASQAQKTMSTRGTTIPLNSASNVRQAQRCSVRSKLRENSLVDMLRGLRAAQQRREQCDVHAEIGQLRLAANNNQTEQTMRGKQSRARHNQQRSAQQSRRTRTTAGKRVAVQCTPWREPVRT